MAQELNLQSKITIDSKEALSRLKNLNKSINSFGKNLQSVGKGIDKFGRGLRNIGKSYSLYVTAPLAGLATLATRNFGIQEESISRMNQSLRAAGRFTESASQEMQEFASQLQRVSIFGDEVTLSASAIAGAFTNSNEQTRQLLTASAEMATLFGTDLQTAVRQLGVTFSGQAGQLARILPEVRNLTEEQLRAGAAIDLVNQKLGGTALAQTQTFNGAIVQLKNDFGDFLELIGSDLAPIVSSMVQFFRSIVDNLNNMEASTRKAIVFFGALAAAIGPILIGLGGTISLIGLLTAGFGAFVAAAPAAIAAITSFVAAAAPIVATVAAISALAIGVAGLVNLFNQLRIVGNTTGESLIKIFRLVGAAIGNFLLFPMRTWIRIIGSVIKRFGDLSGILSNFPGVGAAFEGLQNGLNRLGNSVQSVSDKMKIDFKGAVEEIDNDLRSIGSSTANAMSLGLTNAINGTVESVKNTFKDFTQETDDLFEKSKYKSLENAEEISTQYTGLANNIAQNFSGAFDSIAQGTDSLSGAFKEAMKNIASYIRGAIIQALILRGLSSAFGGSFQTSTNASGQTFGGLLPSLIPGFADGGKISGPGSGTSDSILARVSNGEFISTANAVRHWGSGLYQNLENLAKSGSKTLPKFANGGLVGESGALAGGAGGSNGFRINIENSGSPKEARSATFSQDAQGTVLNIILEDISKNGRVSRTMQSTYGLKRSGL